MSPFKEFIKQQTQNESAGPGRFFTAYSGRFVVGAVDILERYDTLLKSIQDEKPDSAKVREFFELIDQSINDVLNEIEHEDPSFSVSDEQKADIKFSMVFKLVSVLLNAKVTAANSENQEKNKQYLELIRKSPVLTNLAQKYFVDKNVDLGANIDSFYQAAYQKAYDYFEKGISQIQGKAIVNEKGFFEAMKFDSHAAFNALPKEYRERLTKTLWMTIKAKENHYPFSLGGHDDMVISILSKVSTTTVESMAETMTERHHFTPEEIQWMKTTPIASVTMGDNYADAQDSSMSYFNLKKDGAEGSGLKVSARISTRNELRGEVLRKVIREAQITDGNKMVYEVIQDHIRSLDHNNDWIYAQSPVVGHLLSGDQGFIQGFDPGTPVYDRMQIEIKQRVLAFGKKYQEALATHPNLLDESGKLTKEGVVFRDKILNEINEQHPLPENMIKFLNAYNLFEEQMGLLEAQLNEGVSFQKGTERHEILGNLYKDLDSARANLKNIGSKVDLPDGNSHLYDIDDFKQECEKAFQSAANLALKHEQGWWANVFILNVLNDLNYPLPKNVVKFLNTFKLFEEKIQLISAQLQSGEPFKEGTEQYKALENLYKDLDSAKANLIGGDTKVNLPDGTSRQYDIADFKQDCDKAFKTAENSALKHEQGWWARFAKPLLLSIAAFCTAGTLLFSKSVREGIQNVSDNTEGMNKVKDMRSALKDLRATAMHEEVQQNKEYANEEVHLSQPGG